MDPIVALAFLGFVYAWTYALGAWFAYAAGAVARELGAPRWAHPAISATVASIFVAFSWSV